MVTRFWVVPGKRSVLWSRQDFGLFQGIGVEEIVICEMYRCSSGDREMCSDVVREKNFSPYNRPVVVENPVGKIISSSKIHVVLNSIANHEIH